jgi:hypothetical protein
VAFRSGFLCLSVGGLKRQSPQSMTRVGPTRRAFSNALGKVLNNIIQHKNYYFLRLIILFANVDVSRHILVVDTSVLAKNNMNRREYIKSQKLINVCYLSWANDRPSAVGSTITRT